MHSKRHGARLSAHPSAASLVPSPANGEVFFALALLTTEVTGLTATVGLTGTRGGAQW